MFKIEPDRSYTLGEIFGDRLDGLGEEEPFLDKVGFQGGDFSLWKDGIYFLENLKRDGTNICIPFDESAYQMFYIPPRVVRGTEMRNPEICDCTSLCFFIDPVSEEDLIGESFMDETVNTDNPFGGALECREYPYRLFLESDTGLYVSESPAVFFRDVSKHSVDFKTWRPIDYCWSGRMYVPLLHDKMESLVIMMERKDWLFS